MNELNSILNKSVSFQKDAFAPLSHILLIKDVLKGIQEKRLEKQINILREYLKKNDIDNYTKYKKLLPGVTFCATFNEKRRKENLLNYNELIVIDIDKLNTEQILKTKKDLLNDNFVFTFWESPSKNGIKGLIKINYNFSLNDLSIDYIHKCAFKKLVEYFKLNYEIELDESGSDTTRLCFLASDENLVIKTNLNCFEIIKADLNSEVNLTKLPSNTTSQTIRKVKIQDALLNPKGKNSPQNRSAIQSIIKYLTKRKISITDSYDKWYRVAFAISNSFTHDIGERYFLKLCALDGDKFNETGSKNLLINCYEKTKGDIKFSTIFHLAQELGYKPKHNNEGGSEGV